MAGYNRPGFRSDAGVFTNATSYNSQIDNQRQAYLAREENSNRAHGIATDTSLLFSGFRADEIIEAASKQFLSSENPVQPFDNPDFPSEFSADKFKSFAETKISALVSVQSDAPDGPLIGVGPTLATQNMEDAASGTLTNDFDGGHNVRRRGYGWRSPRHEAVMIGSYLSDKYKFNDTNNNDLENVLQGENIDTVIDYNQPEVT